MSRIIDDESKKVNENNKKNDWTVSADDADEVFEPPWERDARIALKPAKYRLRDRQRDFADSMLEVAKHSQTMGEGTAHYKSLMRSADEAWGMPKISRSHALEEYEKLSAPMKEQVDRFQGGFVGVPPSERSGVLPDDLPVLAGTGEILEDGQRDWRSIKQRSLLISELALNALDSNSIGSAMQTCGSTLWFEKLVNTDNKGFDKHLKLANFCRSRLCPMCNWRRSLKISAQQSKVLSQLVKDYRFRLLTLTIKNVAGADLAWTLDNLIEGFRKLMRYKAVSYAVDGYQRSIEVTYNRIDKEFHPHIHVLLVSKKTGYGKWDRSYIPQSDWVKMWKRSMKLDYDPIVDIREVNTRGENWQHAIAEVSKYPLKIFDLLSIGDMDEAIEVFKFIHLALHGRLLITFGGIVKELRKHLGMSDPDEDNNLVNLDDDEEKAIAKWIEKYTWRAIEKQYIC